MSPASRSTCVAHAPVKSKIFTSLSLSSAPCSHRSRDTTPALHSGLRIRACAIKDCFVPSLRFVTTAQSLSYVLSLPLPSQRQIRTPLRLTHTDYSGAQNTTMTINPDGFNCHLRVLCSYGLVSLTLAVALPKIRTSACQIEDLSATQRRYRQVPPSVCRRVLDVKFRLHSGYA